MPTKGTSKSMCCCIGCDSPPISPPVGNFVPDPHQPATDSADPGSQLVQTTCLACMPLQLCLQVACSGNIEPALLTRQDPGCVPYGSPNSCWTGFVSLGSSFVTMQVVFDIVGSDCYLCVVCAELGITGQEPASRILITDGIRALLSPTCQDCQDNLYASGLITWHMTLEGQTCTIIASPVSNVSLNPGLPCPECPDPCYGAKGFIDAPYTICGAVCQGCDCICATACVTVRKSGQIIDSGEAFLCNFTYYYSSSGLPTAISVGYEHDDPSRACVLFLNEGPALDAGDSWPDGTFPLAYGITGQCPDFVAGWSFSSTKGVPYRVDIACAECGICANLKSVPCCIDPLPRLLHVTFDGSACGCPVVVIPVYSATLTGENPWMGSSTDYCDGHVVNLTVGCASDGGFFLTVAYDNQIAPFTYFSTDYGNSGQCLPFSFKFTGINFGGTGVPCQPPYMITPATYTATVTE